MELLGKITLRGKRTSVGIARQCTAAVLEAEDVPLNDALLVVSELVTNALRHTASGKEDGTLTLKIEDAGAHVRIEVMDGGGDLVPQQRRPDEDDDSGRGLLLVAALADKWGTRNLRFGGRGVWAMMSRKARDV